MSGLGSQKLITKFGKVNDKANDSFPNDSNTQHYADMQICESLRVVFVMHAHAVHD